MNADIHRAACLISDVNAAIFRLVRDKVLGRSVALCIACGECAATITRSRLFTYADLRLIAVFVIKRTRYLDFCLACCTDK